MTAMSAVNVLRLSFLLVTASLVVCLSDADYSNSRSKRSVSLRCTEWHKEQESTICLEDNPEASVGSVNSEDIHEILEAHNERRGKVRPVPYQMAKMSWDFELAALASNWAAQCKSYNDKSKSRKVKNGVDIYGVDVGQNIAVGPINWRQLINRWTRIGAKRFTISNGPTNNWDLVKSYWQIIDAHTVRVGCGYAVCKGTQYSVCNYAPSRGLAAEFPYMSVYGATRCSGCPDNCKDGLCDCKGKMCRFGGTLNLRTCTCHCSDIFFGEECEKVKCPKEDDKQCWSRWKEDECGSGHVQARCPYMCAICGEPGAVKKPTTSLSAFNCTFIGTQESEEKCATLGDNGKDKQKYCQSRGGKTYGCNECLSNVFAREACPIMCGVCQFKCPERDHRLCWYRWQEERCSEPSIRSWCPNMCGLCGDEGKAKKPPTTYSDFGCKYIGYPEKEEKCWLIGNWGYDSPECASQGGSKWHCKHCAKSNKGYRDCPIMCGGCKPKRTRPKE